MEKLNINSIQEKPVMDKQKDKVLLLDGVSKSLKKFDIHAHMKEYLDAVDGFYGVEWDTAISSPAMTRIGRTDLHQTLPIQNRMKGVLMNDAGVVTKSLNPATWANETTDGSQGQVMVELPEYYFRFESDGTKRRLLISEYDLPAFELMPKMYMSAYQASLSGSKLASVSGVMAKTSYSRTQFRSAARARGNGWEMMFYNAYKSMLILYFVEYASRNSQLPFNAQPNAAGYKQGGLGEGVTTLSSWPGAPFVTAGFTNTFGNNSGVVQMTTPHAVEVNRYRGIEMPFGHIWHNCDGINIDVRADEDGGTSTCYICDDPAMFSDSSYEGYKNVGLLPRASGYISEMLFGEFMPLIAGGGSTTHWCDYFYASVTSSSLRAVFFGGNAYAGAYAGLACSSTHYAPSSAYSLIGSRLCFFKK